MTRHYSLTQTKLQELAENSFEPPLRSCFFMKEKMIFDVKEKSLENKDQIYVMTLDLEE